MKVSLNAIKQYIDFELPTVDELVARINQQLGQVEGIVDLGERYKDALIVKIVSAEQHPNADRLRVCKIDDGGVRENVPRDDDGYVQVVCGAPNARAGIFAVWLPPQSTVPASYGEKELFVLNARELRGILSQGMLAAADELAIGSDHAGIIEINPDEWKPSDIEIKPGASFAKAYGLDDTIIDIENKMFTHRPDLFGQIGVAREIAGITGHKFKSPDWYWKIPTFGSGEGLELNVSNDAREKVPRFMAVALKNVEVKPSPLWLQIELVRLGSKSINNIVDATNYVMLLTAQPTHAYDYDKLAGHTLSARMAQPGEKITLLNHKEYELSEDDIVIADGNGPVGLAGIMGGGDSEVDEHTKNIVLEVANFDMYAVRKSSMRHGVFTDALTRFNKGQSPLQNDHVLSLLVQSILDVSSGEQASNVYDIKSELKEDGTIAVTTRFVNDRLGLVLSLEEMTRLLKNVEMKVSDEDGSSHPNPNDEDYPVLLVFPPFWRTDIELPEDIVEEVGRLYGFDKLPRELPSRSIKPAAKNASRELKRTLRDTLARAGASEVLTYSFVHEKILAQAGQDPREAYRLGNALSPDLQYYRLSLTPSLLDKIHGNVRAGYDKFALFEIGKAHNKLAAPDGEGLPAEQEHIAFVITSTEEASNSAYYQAKAYVQYVADVLHGTFRYEPLDDSTDAQTASFESKRSAWVCDVKTGRRIGVVGEYRSAVIKAFKLPVRSAGFELDLQALAELAKETGVTYVPLSRYPASERDICFQVTHGTPYSTILEAAETALQASELAMRIIPIDIYQAEASELKNVTIRLTITSYDKTLTSEEVAQVIEEVAQAVIAATNAAVI